MAGGPGDSVMTNTPIYPPFLWTPKTADMQTLQVSLKFEGGREGGQWRMDFAKMEEMVTPTTKMFTLCNPHNPVGKVFTLEVRALVGSRGGWVSGEAENRNYRSRISGSLNQLH
jgi:bifunctional pyridoxal-dependent enzyme with beta-cystathionase and maltose regulon repressor activities